MYMVRMHWVKIKVKKMKRQKARADLGIFYIHLVTTKPQVSIFVFIQIKKLCLSKIRLKIEKIDGGGGGVVIHLLWIRYQMRMGC